MAEEDPEALAVDGQPEVVPRADRDLGDDERAVGAALEPGKYRSVVVEPFLIDEHRGQGGRKTHNLEPGDVPRPDSPDRNRTGAPVENLVSYH